MGGSRPAAASGRSTSDDLDHRHRLRVARTLHDLSFELVPMDEVQWPASSSRERRRASSSSRRPVARRYPDRSGPGCTPRAGSSSRLQGVDHPAMQVTAYGRRHVSEDRDDQVPPCRPRSYSARIADAPRCTCTPRAAASRCVLATPACVRSTLCTSKPDSARNGRRCAPPLLRGTDATPVSSPGTWLLRKSLGWARPGERSGRR